MSAAWTDNIIPMIFSEQILTYRGVFTAIKPVAWISVNCSQENSSTFCWVVSGRVTLPSSLLSKASNPTAVPQSRCAHSVVAHPGPAAVRLSQDEAQLIADNY